MIYGLFAQLLLVILRLNCLVIVCIYMQQTGH